MSQNSLFSKGVAAIAVGLKVYNQIKLPQDVIDDLGLKLGDLVFFVKNDATKRWELHPESEVMEKSKIAWHGSGKGESPNESE